MRSRSPRDFGSKRTQYLRLRINTNPMKMALARFMRGGLDAARRMVRETVSDGRGQRRSVPLDQRAVACWGARGGEGRRRRWAAVQLDA